MVASKENEPKQNSRTLNVANARQKQPTAAFSPKLATLF